MPKMQYTANQQLNLLDEKITMWERELGRMVQQGAGSKQTQMAKDRIEQYRSERDDLIKRNPQLD